MPREMEVLAKKIGDMKPVFKEYDTEYTVLKADDGAPSGEIEALVSTYGHVDKQGDRINYGAYADTLKAWRNEDDPIPHVFSHNYRDPMAFVGEWDPDRCEEIQPSDRFRGGLLLKGKMDINEGNPVAEQVHRLLLKRRVREFSPALRILPEWGKRAQDMAYDVMKADLLEAGACFKGIGQSHLISAKALLELDDGYFEDRDVIEKAAADIKRAELLAPIMEALSAVERDVEKAVKTDDTAEVDKPKAISAVQAAHKALMSMVEGDLEKMSPEAMVTRIQDVIKQLQTASRAVNPKPKNPFATKSQDMELAAASLRLIEIGMDVQEMVPDPFVREKHNGPGLGPHWHPHLLNGVMVGGSNPDATSSKPTEAMQPGASPRLSKPSNIGPTGSQKRYTREDVFKMRRYLTPAEMDRLGVPKATPTGDKYESVTRQQQARSAIFDALNDWNKEGKFWAGDPEIFDEVRRKLADHWQRLMKEYGTPEAIGEGSAAGWTRPNYKDTIRSFNIDGKEVKGEWQGGTMQKLTFMLEDGSEIEVSAKTGKVLSKVDPKLTDIMHRRPGETERQYIQRLSEWHQQQAGKTATPARTADFLDNIAPAGEGPATDKVAKALRNGKSIQEAVDSLTQEELRAFASSLTSPAVSLQEEDKRYQALMAAIRARSKKAKG